MCVIFTLLQILIYRNCSKEKNTNEITKSPGHKTLRMFPNSFRTEKYVIILWKTFSRHGEFLQRQDKLRVKKDKARKQMTAHGL